MKHIIAVTLIALISASTIFGHPVKSKEEYRAKQRWEYEQVDTLVLCAMSAAVFGGGGAILTGAIATDNTSSKTLAIQRGFLIAGGVIFAIGLVNLTRNWEGSGAQKKWYERKKWDYRVMQATGFHQIVASNNNSKVWRTYK